MNCLNCNGTGMEPLLTNAACGFCQPEEYMECPKCGEGTYRKLVGDEVYDWCEEDGCMEQ